MLGGLGVGVQAPLISALAGDARPRSPPAAAGQVHQGADLRRPGQVHRRYTPGTRPVVEGLVPSQESREDFPVRFL